MERRQEREQRIEKREGERRSGTVLFVSRHLTRVATCMCEGREMSITIHRGCEQRVKCREERAESREQRAESREQRAESREQRAEGSLPRSVMRCAAPCLL
jgi:hypothetical protein